MACGVLNARGWLATTGPRQGRHGLEGGAEVHLRGRVRARAAPRIVPFGVNMLGPVLIKFGTEAQKARFLPRILDGDDWWCQGYSEPGAGSDLAS